MAPLHGKVGSLLRSLARRCGPSGFVGCLSPGPRKNDLTIYWALGPFVRSFTLLVDPGDIYPPQATTHQENLCKGYVVKPCQLTLEVFEALTDPRQKENHDSWVKCATSAEE
jgi:hypothetical protein